MTTECVISPDPNDLCQRRRKWGVLVNASVFGLPKEEMQLAAPYLSDIELDRLIEGEQLLFLCDYEIIARTIYRLTIGEDGPNTYNRYNGKARFYAVLINQYGSCVTENT